MALAYNGGVQRVRSLEFVLCIALAGCQAVQSPGIAMIDGDRDPQVLRSATTVEAALAEAGVVLGPGDRVLVRGYPTALNEPLAGPMASGIQIQHALRVTINGRPLETTAATVGEAVAGAGNELYAADLLQPPADWPVVDGMEIAYTASRPEVLSVDGRQVHVRTAAATTGEALAESGIPEIGLDVIQPADDQPPPDSAEIGLTRVAESVVLAQELIPFETTYQDSPEVALGREQVVQPGATGLSVTRSTVRFENGREVARNSEASTIVNPPENRIVARGTKVVNRTLAVNGAAIEYWLQMQMYATTYSPCESASGGCSYGTASGRRAGKGVVAVDPALYAYLNGQRLYIPGYGYAVIGDVGGGYIVENNIGVSRYKWIDLGFDDGSIEDMSGWITVYFLAPAPATIPDVLK